MIQSAQSITQSYQHDHEESAHIMKLIDGNLARCAYSNTSRYPSQTAALARIEFSELLFQARSDISDAILAARRDVESNAPAIQQWFEATAKELATSYSQYLSAQAQCMDVRITGSRRYELSLANECQKAADSAWQSMLDDLADRKRVLLRTLLSDEYLITTYSERRAVLHLH